MRQGQQNRRGRGRPNNNHGQQHNQGNNNNNNNRKGQNPLSRSYESNGPDVKIRGNPAHIAEKYMTLARDAQSAGDSVQAEAYFQHAEHYNRIIMEFRESQVRPGDGQQINRVRSGADGGDGGSDDFGDQDADYSSDPSSDTAAQQVRGQEPQPGMFDQPGGRFNERQPERQPREDRGYRDDRGNRDDRGFRDGPREPRDDRPQRQFDDRQPRRNDGNRGQRDRFGDGQQRGYNSPDRPERIDPRREDQRRDRYDRNQSQDRNGNTQDRDRGPDRTHDRNQERPGFDRPMSDRAPNERHSPDRSPSDRGDRGYAERQAFEREQPVAEVAATVAVVAMPPVVVDEPAPAPMPEAVEPRAPRRRGAAAPAADRFAPTSQDAPEFLRRPVVRRPRREPAAAETVDAVIPVLPAADEVPDKTT